LRLFVSRRENDVGVGEALECLFRGKWPRFIQKEVDFINQDAE